MCARTKQVVVLFGLNQNVEHEFFCNKKSVYRQRDKGKKIVTSYCYISSCVFVVDQLIILLYYRNVYVSKLKLLGTLSAVGRNCWIIAPGCHKTIL